MEINDQKPLIVELRKPKFERIALGIKNTLYFLLTAFVLLAVIGGISSDALRNESFAVRYTDWYGNEQGFALGEEPPASVALINLNGMIVNAQMGLYDGVMSEDVLRMLNEAENDPTVKALVLRIDSPGGTVIDSEKIAQKITEVKKVKKVYVLVESLAASGGYYIASQADKIFAYRESLVGSIGVVMELPNAKELMDKVGVDMMAITSGKMKSMGSPFAVLTDEERAIFQELVNESYEGFLARVSSGRGLSPEAVRELADGRIFSATQALDKKLIDGTGGLADLQATLAQSGVGDLPLKEFYLPISSWEGFFRPLGRALHSWFSAPQGQMTMYYR